LVPVYRIGTKNILFLHVPKTAGMAVDAHLAALGPAVFNTRFKTRNGVFGPRHQPASVLEKVYFPEMIDYAFMIVRHPVARMVSAYRYNLRKGGLQVSRLFGFDIWLRLALWRTARNPNWNSGHLLPQVVFEGFSCEVFRYEDGLDKAMQAVARVTGVDIPARTPPTNVSAPRPVQVSQASLDRIARAYAADFERFGYATEPPVLKGVTYGR
jgi:hypothetical protein